jgi:glycine hydroxymethyltransferase
MTTISETEIRTTEEILARTGEMLARLTPEQAKDKVVEIVRQNEEWRGKQCLDLLAPEALMSPTARRLLSSELSQRAGEGEIGNRWFAGTRYIDELEALCVELAKRLFRCNFADHRMVSGMVSNTVVYFALTQPGDIVMSLPKPAGGHSSNRMDGPAGLRGCRIVDVPFDPHEDDCGCGGFPQRSGAGAPAAYRPGFHPDPYRPPSSRRSATSAPHCPGQGPLADPTLTLRSPTSSARHTSVPFSLLSFFPCSLR